MKLKDICIIQSGGTPSRSKKEYWENGTIPWVKISDFSAKHIINTQESITEQGMNCSSAKLFPKGTLLYTIFATIGEVGILDIDATTNQAIVGIMIKNSMVDQEYLYYYLMSLKDYVNRIGRGVAQNNINMSILRELEIPLPPIEKQKKISNIFIQLDKMIEQRQNQIDLIDELVKSRFIEMFGSIVNSKYNYETCKLGEVAKVSSSHRVFTTEFVEKGIPFYRGTEIGELANGQQPSNPYYISEEHYERLTNDDTKPQIGDLLMPSICNKGQVWMVDTQEPFYYKDGRVLCISPDKSIFNSKFLQYFMREKTLIEYPKMGSGSTFAEFKIFLLKEMDVLVPPREIQEQFADFVAQTDKSKLAVQKSLDELETLKKSLMQEYFG